MAFTATCTQCEWRTSFEDYRALNDMAIHHAMKALHEVLVGYTRRDGGRWVFRIVPEGKISSPKRFSEWMDCLKEERRRRVKPDPPPRYDDVFYESLREMPGD